MVPHTGATLEHAGVDRAGAGADVQSPASLDLSYHPSPRGRQTPATATRAVDESAPGPSSIAALEKQIAKSARPDCKDAYSHLGLLAAARILWDAAKDDGCKW